MHRGEQRDSTLTNRGDHGRLLTVLILEAGSDPLAIGRRHGHVADTREHEAGRHDERGEDSDGRPGPAAAEDGGQEPDSKNECEAKGANSAPEGPVDGGTVGDGDRCQSGELDRKRFRVKSSGRKGEKW